MILMRTLDFIEANAAVWSFVMSYMAIVWIPSPGAGTQYACLPDCLPAVWPGCLIPAWVRLFIRTDNNNNCQLQSAAVVARHSAVQRGAPRDMLRFFHIQFQMKFSCCQHQNPVPNPSQNPVTGLRISPPLPLSLSSVWCKFCICFVEIRFSLLATPKSFAYFRR